MGIKLKFISTHETPIVSTLFPVKTLAQFILPHVVDRPSFNNTIQGTSNIYELKFILNFISLYIIIRDTTRERKFV